MWNRQRLKCNARVLLKANYLKVVVVGLILSFLIGSGYNSARGAAKSNDVDIDVTDLFSRNLAFIVAMLIGIAGVIAIALLFNVILNIFLWNPLEVGCRKVFVDCRYGNAEWSDILYAFKNGYGHIGVVMFMKDLFTFLWTLLFIIPGIIKGYEYSIPSCRESGYEPSGCLCREQAYDGWQQDGCLCTGSVIYRLVYSGCHYI